MTAPRFGFQDRLSAEFPSQVIVDATEICNLACIHCPHPTFKRSPHYGGRHVDPALVARAVEEVAAHAHITGYVRFSANGEPFTHPQLFEMLAHAVARSGVAVTLTTNGTLIDAPRADALLATGVDLVDVSIDAARPDTYARIRVNGRLEVTRANVLGLIARRDAARARTRVVVSFVMQPENAAEADEFTRFWSQSGADRVLVRPLHSNAAALAPVADRLRASPGAAERYPCLYPFERILLNARGELAFCPQDWEHASVLANYADTTIREVWQGEAYRRLRDAHLVCSLGAHAFCGRCPDWQLTRWPHQGRAYANLVADIGPRRPGSA